MRLCWSNGVSAKWFGGKVNEKEMGSRSRHSIVLKKKQDRVFMMVKSRELREEKFKNRDQFNEEVLKGMSTFSVHNYYH